MAEYEKEKDLTIAHRQFNVKEDEVLEVAIKRYNDGEKKFQISRYSILNNQQMYKKLGRLTINETNAIVDMINELKPHFE